MKFLKDIFHGLEAFKDPEDGGARIGNAEGYEEMYSNDSGDEDDSPLEAPKKKRCPDCGGTGDTGQGQGYASMCNRCNGTGEVKV